MTGSLGPYEIVGPLGRGGMGEVYRARDRRLGRDVALKILRDRAEVHPDRIQRFVAEARAASALNHPNIVAVFDAAVDGDTPYIVTELIDGESLANEIRRGPIALKRLLDLATQIADGLADAHAAGIVHGDLKPENIMITRGGRAKIVDFGLARAGGLPESDASPEYTSQETETAPGLRGGTVPYMSPEQARGEATDFRSDQFAFGLVLYEMATGRPAFRRGTPAETLEAICHDEPAPIAPLNAQAPLLLWWIVERCLAKQAADRYGVTADLYRDLRMLRDRLADAVAREAALAAGVPVRRARLSAAVAAGALALLGAVAAIATLLWMPQPADLSTLRFQPLATEAVFEGYPAWSPDGMTVAYVADVGGVLQVHTRRLNSTAADTVTDRPFDAKYPFWSKDGRQIYHISRAGDRDGLWTVAAAGGLAKNVLRNVSRATLSPDGRLLAFFRDEQRADVVGTAAVWLANVDGTQERRYDLAPFGDLRFSDGMLQFSPDGRYLAVCAVPNTIALAPGRRGWQFWLLPMPDGAPVRKLQRVSEVASPRLTTFSWLPDSRHVVLDVAANNPGAHLWMADLERETAWPLTYSTGTEFAPSVSPKEQRLAFSAGEPDYDLFEVPLDDGPIEAILATSKNETDPVWTADGRAYAFVTDRSGQDEIWQRTIDAPFSETALVRTERDFGDDRTFMLAAPAVAPRGGRLAYQRNAGRPVWPLRIWHSLGSGPPTPVLSEQHEGYQGSPTWSPDGEWIAFAEWNVQRWRLVKVRLGGSPPEMLRDDGVANATAQWSPAGDWITWETADGFVLASPDGRKERRLQTEQWLVHTWSADGATIYGIRETDDRRLVLEAADIRTGQVRVLRDLRPSPPANNPVRGLSVHPTRRSLLTSMVKVPIAGDIWLLEGFRPPERLIDRLWRRLRGGDR